MHVIDRRFLLIGCVVLVVFGAHSTFAKAEEADDCSPTALAELAQSEPKIDRCPDPKLREKIHELINDSKGYCASHDTFTAARLVENATELVQECLNSSVEAAGRTSPAGARPERSSGCVGESLVDCLQYLRRFFAYSDDEIKKEIERSQRMDVNGNRIGENQIMFIGYIREAPGKSSINISYDSNKIVYLIEVELPDNPGLAQTEQEYDRTGLYQAAQIGIGSSCSRLSDKIAVYKFFHNDVKPKIVVDPGSNPKIEWKPTGVSRLYFEKASDIQVCGVSITFTNLFGYDTEYITLENPHGATNRTTISFFHKSVP